VVRLLRPNQNENHPMRNPPLPSSRASRAGIILRNSGHLGNRSTHVRAAHRLDPIQVAGGIGPGEDPSPGYPIRGDRGRDS
jgi:hypothetical protein